MPVGNVFLIFRDLWETSGFHYTQAAEGALGTVWVFWWPVGYPAFWLFLEDPNHSPRKVENKKAS